jgi:transposase
MNDEQRTEIIRRFYGGTSFRRIARALDLDRKTVAKVVAAHQKQRSEPHSALQPPVRRSSLLDPYQQQIEDLLARYPDLTAVRLHEELAESGFKGAYTIVRERLRSLRPKPVSEPVVRFETGPGVQAQMDYSPFDIDFTAEGRRRVYAFSYILGYSRRRYLSFVDSQDFTTSIREHVCAFEYLGGVATVCLYDSMKVVVLCWEGEQPVYNPRFLAFCIHYGYRPWACKRRRPRTKGKVEEPFKYAVLNLLNGRTFTSREDLNVFTREVWLPKVDRRPHDTTRRPPLELWGAGAPAPATHARSPLRHRGGLLSLRGAGVAHPLPRELLLRPLDPDRAVAAGACHRDRADRLRSRPTRGRPPCPRSARAPRETHPSRARPRC